MNPNLYHDGQVTYRNAISSYGIDLVFSQYHGNIILVGLKYDYECSLQKYLETYGVVLLCFNYMNAS